MRAPTPPGPNPSPQLEGPCVACRGPIAPRNPPAAQEILEKFEFFPIKCRIQRAARLFRRSFDDKQRRQQLRDLFPRPLKTKVIRLLNNTGYCRR